MATLWDKLNKIGDDYNWAFSLILDRNLELIVFCIVIFIAFFHFLQLLGPCLINWILISLDVLCHLLNILLSHLTISDMGMHRS